ncbi:hypothetical protein D1007_37002 [Hordeum vulgare]|nr:hypothetical protein D1007_37002 [Hordeum vulgare]
MEEVDKEFNTMVKKATPKELKMPIPDPPNDAISVDILHWSMNEADFGDAGQRAKWVKYRQYSCPHDHRAALYFTTQTVVVTLEEDQEEVAKEVEEEDVVTMIVTALEQGHRIMTILLDSGEEEETMVHVEEKT